MRSIIPITEILKILSLLFLCSLVLLQGCEQNRVERALLDLIESTANKAKPVMENMQFGRGNNQICGYYALWYEGEAARLFENVKIKRGSGGTREFCPGTEALYAKMAQDALKDDSIMYNRYDSHCIWNGSAIKANLPSPQNPDPVCTLAIIQAVIAGTSEYHTKQITTTTWSPASSPFVGAKTTTKDFTPFTGGSHTVARYKLKVWLVDTTKASIRGFKEFPPPEWPKEKFFSSISKRPQDVVAEEEPVLRWLNELWLEENKARGEYIGIGSVVEINTDLNLPQIVYVYPDSPSARSGLLRGMIITKVGGIPTQGRTIGQVVEMLKGQKGTQVVIEVEGAIHRTKKIVEVIRDRIRT